MESRTPAVTRVLEALSPALSAEIERIVAETHSSLETEFQRRVHEAAQDAEASVQRAIQELDGKIAEARDSAHQQATVELQAEYQKNLDDATMQLRSRLEKDFENAACDWAAEREALKRQVDELRVFAEAQLQMTGAATQAGILSRFLKVSSPFAAAIAVYVTKADGLALWKSRGQTAFPEIISQQTADPEAFFRLIVIREKTVAAVCATGPLRAEMLHFLCGLLECAIEMFGLKLRGPVRPSPEWQQTTRPHAASQTAD